MKEDIARHQMITYHHIVSATALSHHTARPSIFAISSLFGLSEMSAVRRNVAKIACGRAAHTGFALPVAPQMLRCRGGGLCRAHSVGRPPSTPRQRVTIRESFCWMDVVVSLSCCRLPPTVLATWRHRRGWDVAMKLENVGGYSQLLIMDDS